MDWLTVTLDIVPVDTVHCQSVSAHRSQVKNLGYVLGYKLGYIAKEADHAAADMNSREKLGR